MKDYAHLSINQQRITLIHSIENNCIAAIELTVTFLMRNRSFDIKLEVMSLFFCFSFVFMQQRNLISQDACRTNSTPNK